MTAMMNDNRSPMVMDHNGSPVVADHMAPAMVANRASAMNNDLRFFDGNLYRVALQRTWRDGRSLHRATHHAEAQNGGDHAFPKAT
jgi:hypothetical protein